MQTQTPTTAPVRTFALAGQLVGTPAHAERILRSALQAQKAWLIPQARSVLRQLSAQGGAA